MPPESMIGNVTKRPRSSKKPSSLLNNALVSSTPRALADLNEIAAKRRNHYDEAANYRMTNLRHLSLLSRNLSDKLNSYQQPKLQIQDSSTQFPIRASGRWIWIFGP